MSVKLHVNVWKSFGWGSISIEAHLHRREDCPFAVSNQLKCSWSSVATCTSLHYSIFMLKSRLFFLFACFVFFLFFFQKKAQKSLCGFDLKCLCECLTTHKALQNQTTEQTGHCSHTEGFLFCFALRWQRPRLHNREALSWCLFCAFVPLCHRREGC